MDEVSTPLPPSLSSGRRGPVLWCLLAALLFGGSTPAAKALLAELEPLTLAGVLYLGAAAGVFPFCWRGGLPRRWRDRRNLLALGGAVLFGGVLGPAALLFGLSMAPSASVSLWLNLETVATAVLAATLFREHLSRRDALACALVVAAGILLAAPSDFAMVPAATLVALACLCWGLDNNLTAIIDGFTPEQSTFAKGAVAGTFNLTAGLLLGGGLPSAGAVGAGLAIGALGYGASIVFYIRGAQNLGATRSQLLFSSAPFLGVILAWTVLGEEVLWMQIVAGGILVSALALMLSSRHEHQHEHSATSHTHLHRHDDGHHDHAHPDQPVETWHTHAHSHEPLRHSHAHQPDIHHRHDHEGD